jgi:hypothetical protein
MADLSFASFDDLPSGQDAARAPQTVPSDAVCPKCEAATFQRSHVRWYERWRRVTSGFRPFRCAACGHRAWIAPPAVSFHAEIEIGRPVDDVDLSALDVDWTDSAPTQSL